MNVLFFDPRDGVSIMDIFAAFNSVCFARSVIKEEPIWMFIYLPNMPIPWHWIAKVSPQHMYITSDVSPVHTAKIQV